MKQELYHHGVLGQKWGKRNGPPYPLSSSVSTGKRLKKDVDNAAKSKSVRRAAKKDPKAVHWISEEIAYEMRYKTDDEEVNRSITKLVNSSNALDQEVNSIFETSKKEIGDLNKNSDFKTDLINYLKSNPKENIRSAAEKILYTDKYMPETVKKRKQLESDIEKYYDSVSKEIERILGAEGSKPISTIKTGTTYSNVLEKILEYHTRDEWTNNLLEQTHEYLADLLFDFEKEIKV